MQNDLLDPQLVEAYRSTDERQALMGPPPKTIEEIRERAAQGRLWWNEGGPSMASVEEHTVPGPVRPIPIVIYRPTAQPSKLPAYVYLHGGGFRIGNPRSNDRQLREIAAAWGGIVVSADYAHTPEHVFPTPVDECVAVYRYLAAHGEELGIDGTRLAFGGSSAGANVALAAAIQLGAEGRRFLQGGALVVGVYDDDTETESMRQFDKLPMVLSRDSVIATLQQYVTDPAQRADPRVRCTDADLSHLPPLFIASAAVDVLRDSSRRLAARLAAGNQPHRYKEYARMAHLFFGFSRTVDGAAQCVQDIASFLAEQVPVAGKA
jgi:acetyl esterase